MPIPTSPYHVLITSDVDSEGVSLEELRSTGIANLPGQWLDTGDTVQGSILLVGTDLPFADFSSRLAESGSIFIRHLAPVDHQLDLNGDETDLATICSLLPMVAGALDPQWSFSVQTRILGTGKLPYRKVVLNETLSQAIEKETSAEMDCREPQQVISILCSPEKAYVGVSNVRDNLSAWPGGKHRFRKEDEQVSRAEFKLLEAFSVFDLELPEHGFALDIGASPGGWTRILAERGFKVDAVDPGDLDPRLRRDRNIVHFRKRIQEYSPGSKRFHVIVNDMKMDARESIDLMLRFAPRLSEDGVAIMTLKLPQMSNETEVARNTLAMVREDLDRLRSGFEVIGARQLYHNRNEVTVAMRSSGSSSRR